MRLQRAAEPSLLPLTVLVALLLTTGRWGSYLGLPSWNVYAAEVGLVLTASWLLLRHRQRFSLARLRPLVPLLALGAWSLIRFSVGGQYDVDALRDLAPYVYVVAALAACFVTSAHGKSLVVIEAGLVVHLLWVYVTLLAPEWSAGLPLLGDKVRVLELRPDFDGAALAVLTCLMAVRAGQRTSPPGVRVASAIAAAVSVYAILQMGSRAGLLALVVDIGVIAVVNRHILSRILRPPMLAAAGLMIVVVAVAFPHTYAYERLTADPTERTDAATGTLDARQEAWGLVIDDATATPSRLVLGSGFGPDFLDRSGADVAFEGFVERDVRAPHNFVLNTLARIGLVGAALLGWVAFSLGGAVLRLTVSSSSPTPTRFHIFTILLLGAIAVASLVGVILESPFGAVPFWWAAGFLLVTAARPKVPQDAGSARSPATKSS